jgi:hypothetical protein
MTNIPDAEVDLSISSTIVVKHVHHLVESVNNSFSVFLQIHIFIHKTSDECTLATLGLAKKNYFVFLLLLCHIK